MAERKRPLPGRGHTNLWTIGLNGATGAPRRDGPAKGLAEGHEEIVIENPVFFGQDFSERELRLFRSFGADEPEPVRNSVDMGIDADPQFTEPQREHEIGRLSSHAF